MSMFGSNRVCWQTSESEGLNCTSGQPVASEFHFLSNSMDVSTMREDDEEMDLDEEEDEDEDLLYGFAALLLTLQPKFHQLSTYGTLFNQNRVR